MLTAVFATCAAAALDTTMTNNTVLVVRVGFWSRVVAARKETWPLCDEQCVGQVMWGSKQSVARVLSESSGGVFGFSRAASPILKVPIAVGVYDDPCAPTGTWHALAQEQVQASGIAWTQFSVRMWVYPSAAGGGTCTEPVYTNATARDVWVRYFDVPTVVRGVGSLLGMQGEEGLDASDPMCNVGTPQLFPAARRLFAGWNASLSQRKLDLTSPMMTTVVLSSADDVVVGAVPLVHGGGVVVIQWRSSFVDTTDVWMEGPNAVFVHWLLPSGRVAFLGRLEADQSLHHALPGSMGVGVTVPRIAAAWGDATPVVFGVCEMRPPSVQISSVDRMVTLTNNDLRCAPRSFVVTAMGAPVFACVNATVRIMPDAHAREMGVVIYDSAGRVLLRHSQHSRQQSEVTLLHCSDQVQEELQVQVWDKGGEGQGAFWVFANGHLVEQEDHFDEEATVTVTCAWQW